MTYSFSNTLLTWKDAKEIEELIDNYLKRNSLKIYTIGVADTKKILEWLKTWFPTFVVNHGLNNFSLTVNSVDNGPWAPKAAVKVAFTTDLVALWMNFSFANPGHSFREKVFCGKNMKVDCYGEYSSPFYKPKYFFNKTLLIPKVITEPKKQTKELFEFIDNILKDL